VTVSAVETTGAAQSTVRPYLCDIEFQPSHLVPAGQLGALRADRFTGALMVNPSARLQGTWNPSREVLVPDAIATDPETVWVWHPGTRALTPYRPGTRTAEVLAASQPGSPPAAHLPPRTRRLLKWAGILVPAGHPDRAVASWRRTSSDCQDEFRQGFATVRGLIHPFHLGELRRHYRWLVRTGRAVLGDGQSSKRYWAHNEPVSRFFHHQLASAVGDIVGRPVKPSYVYVASYRAGANLPVHTDRAQCEYTMTMCIDFSPEPESQTPWPLQLEVASGRMSVHQALGDALIYGGPHTPHGRPVLGPGQFSTSVFFHYVDQAFAGPLD
jgi:hypothetical protein